MLGHFPTLTPFPRAAADNAAMPWPSTSWPSAAIRRASRRFPRAKNHPGGAAPARPAHAGAADSRTARAARRAARSRPDRPDRSQERARLPREPPECRPFLAASPGATDVDRGHDWRAQTHRPQAYGSSRDLRCGLASRRPPAKDQPHPWHRARAQAESAVGACRAARQPRQQMLDFRPGSLASVLREYAVYIGYSRAKSGYLRDIYFNKSVT